jgi:NTP pyrophosphatase (non-canonical NTP hydrolase)
VYNGAMTLNDLQKKVVAFRNEREWQQFHNPKDLALSLVLEATEVLEHFQWRNGAEITDRVGTHRDEIAEEMADVLWYLLLLADEADVDLGRALERKLDKNVQRYSIQKARGNHKKYSEFEDND